MLEPPIKDGKAELKRVIAEALAQFTPVTAALAHLYKATHPSQYDLDREEFYQLLCEELKILTNRPRYECFGSIRFEPRGSPSSDGFNVSSVVSYSAERIQINFITPFAQADYHVDLQQDGWRPTLLSRSVFGFEVELKIGHYGLLTYAVSGELAS